MNDLETKQKKPRMLLLMRNSTKKQAEKIVAEDGHVEYDIPLQRAILRPWGESLGYDVLETELVEGGVSGYKVSANNRDEISRLKKMADNGEFEVLGIYMSDRLGRIADETPLIVSFLNDRGIKVLSYVEGEISAKTHNDKLMTYIRFWQAEGESLKTSIRIKDANEKGVEQGKWRGGSPPYGYRTVSRGTLNFKGKPIFDVEIDPATSEVVKRIYKLYLDHYSSKRIAQILNDEGIPTHNGGKWACNTVQKILRNRLYTGYYELGKTSGNVRVVSPLMEHLRFIDDETFNAVREMVAGNRKTNLNGKRPTVRGSRLLTGLVQCECGEKYSAHTQIDRKIRSDGSLYESEHCFYRCASHRHPSKNACKKKPINADKFEKAIVDDAKKFLLETDIEKLLVTQEDKYIEKEKELGEQIKRINRESAQKEKELGKLKDEVYKTIVGQSSFSQDLLSELIGKKQQEVNELRAKNENLDKRLGDIRELLAYRRKACSDLTNWADRFDLQETDEKKSMLINLINKITVFDDKIEVKYKIRFDKDGDLDYNDNDFTDGSMVGTDSGQLASDGAKSDFFCQTLAQRGTLARM